MLLHRDLTSRIIGLAGIHTLHHNDGLRCPIA
jgi:hypothetical protein